MDAVAAGESVELDDETTIEGVQEFGLGTFSMPSMEGDSFEAPARTIEVATGFLGAVKKDVEHDDMVVDFLMYYSSPEGFAIYTDALIENGGRPDGIPLVNGVELEGELADMFSNITYIGNVQKGWARRWLAALATTRKPCAPGTPTPWTSSMATSPSRSGPRSTTRTSCATCRT